MGSGLVAGRADEAVGGVGEEDVEGGQAAVERSPLEALRG